jgi:thiamine biosynthesis lipoprotein
MGTFVTMQVVRDDDPQRVQAAMDRAFGWFHAIEQRCTRFGEQSELNQLTACCGTPVPVSAILFEAVRFAVMVAHETQGAFDPTVGHRMEARGFNREYRTGEVVRSERGFDLDVSYRDIALDADRRTITLRRPLRLDLGAVVKGLAIDAAARELEQFRDFAVDAGGDLYLGGLNSEGKPWSVGIRHPRRDGELIDFLCVSNQGVCTSGDYERRVGGDAKGEHHMLDPRTGKSPDAVSSATVVASGAMLADALATAVFVLGPGEGLRFLERMGVDGLIFTRDLERFETRGLVRAA